MPANKNTKNKKGSKSIGVFDSGVGGLSILKELQKTLPNENFVFLADQKYVPYGEKSKKELIKLVYRITDYFIEHHNIKMMVVACNTATCGTINELREKYSFPIIGTVPAIKVAAEKTRSGTIAVISTPSTSQSEALKDLIRDNCENLEVLNIDCKNLENAVETGNFDNPNIDNLLLKYLEKIKNSDADYLVLGCTHYPFLKKSIRKIVGSRVKLLDSGKAISRHTSSLLKNKFMKNAQKKLGKNKYFTTGDSKEFSKVASILLNKKIKTKGVKI
ncbi:glutamate racemase [Candidatus Nomurabacteria bacterium]|nr:glutamate racemase [Candidatus Nomurabacteria bacterium]